MKRIKPGEIVVCRNERGAEDLVRNGRVYAVQAVQFNGLVICLDGINAPLCASRFELLDLDYDEMESPSNANN